MSPKPVASQPNSSLELSSTAGQSFQLSHGAHRSGIVLLNFLIWISILGVLSARASDYESRLLLTAPGEALDWAQYRRAPHAAPEVPRSGTWNMVALEGRAIRIEALSRTRDSGWRQQTRSTGKDGNAIPLGEPKKDSPPKLALDFPDNGLLAFRFHAEGQTKTPPDRSVIPGIFQSLLEDRVVLHDRWQKAISLSGKRWTLGAEGVRRPDGALLAGSLTLVARRDGESRVLVPPARGRAFARQELLWIGSLRSEWEFDLLLRRTWLTGEIEYLLVVGGHTASILVDADRPYRVFSSGAEETATLEWNIGQARQMPLGRFGSAAFTVAEDDWNGRLQEASVASLPTVIFDRQLPLAGESIRFQAEYLPRLSEKDGEPDSAFYPSFYQGPAIVRVRFLGVSQILSELAPQDGGPLRFEVGMIDDSPAIRIIYRPHYNNSMTDTWIWDTAQSRFLRLLRRHSQGC